MAMHANNLVLRKYKRVTNLESAWTVSQNPVSEDKTRSDTKIMGILVKSRHNESKRHEVGLPTQFPSTVQS